jgi:hypothetical protein
LNWLAHASNDTRGSRAALTANRDRLTCAVWFLARVRLRREAAIEQLPANALLRERAQTPFGSFPSPTVPTVRKPA